MEPAAERTAEGVIVELLPSALGESAAFRGRTSLGCTFTEHSEVEFCAFACWRSCESSGFCAGQNARTDFRDSSEIGKAKRQ